MCCNVFRHNCIQLREIRWSMYPIEAVIGHPLLWTSCRHHMLKVILEDVFKVIFGPSSSPKVEFFDILKSKWPTLN